MVILTSIASVSLWLEIYSEMPPVYTTRGRSAALDEISHLPSLSLPGSLSPTFSLLRTASLFITFPLPLSSRCFLTWPTAYQSVLCSNVSSHDILSSCRQTRIPCDEVPATRRQVARIGRSQYHMVSVYRRRVGNSFEGGESGAYTSNLRR